jgi:serine/threonine-protein kinase
MKRLRGTTLKDVLESKQAEVAARYPRTRLLRAFVEVCLAIELAHSRGVIHRDLKPANIMLGDYGEVYVIDWGVAKVVGQTELDSLGDAPLVDGSTLAGAVIGTPGYMAPEQLRGADIDGRADVYALGCVLFELLAGAPLHPHGKQRSAAPIDARPSRRAPEREIAPELDALCAAASADHPDDRVRTARALGEAIQRYLDGDRDVAQRRALATDHFARARTALDHGDGDDARGTAMREAGRALALDPTLIGPAELVGRLMLEPPTTTPVEVEQAIEAEAHEGGRRYARVALYGYLGYSLCLAEFLWGGVRDTRYFASFAVVLAANIASAWFRSRSRSPGNAYWNVILGNAALVAVVARGFSPMMIGPGVAVATIMVMIPSPSIRTKQVAIAATALMILAVLVPWLAEYSGLISRTMWIENNTLMVRSPALSMHAVAVQTGLTVYSIVLIGFAGLMAFVSSGAERAARHRLHLQAWQLRQLMPTGG